MERTIRSEERAELVKDSAALQEEKRDVLLQRKALSTDIEAHEEVKAQHAKDKEALDEAMKDFSREVEEFKRMMRDAETHVKGDSWIRINVGGKLFDTRRQTLASISPFFAGLLDERLSPSTDSEGWIFVDRDPAFMPILLNYARNGCDMKVITKALENCPQRSYQLRKELEYYGIITPDLPPQIGEKIDILWRGGGGLVYQGVVLDRGRQVQPAEAHSQTGKSWMTVKYNDGDIWRYDLERLSRKQGEYRESTFHPSFNGIAWVHYKHAICEYTKERCSCKQQSESTHTDAEATMGSLATLPPQD